MTRNEMYAVLRGLLAGEKVEGSPAHDLKPREPSGAEGAEWSRVEPSGAERSRAERGTPSLNGLSAELNLEPCYFCRAKGPLRRDFDKTNPSASVHAPPTPHTTHLTQSTDSTRSGSG